MTRFLNMISISTLSRVPLATNLMVSTYHLRWTTAKRLKKILMQAQSVIENGNHGIAIGTLIFNIFCQDLLVNFGNAQFLVHNRPYDRY